MTASVRFAHISDVHLPLEAAPPLLYMNLKRSLGLLNWLRKRRYVHTRAALDAIVADIKREAPDHILVSGDLINIGLPSEYEAARTWLESVGTPQHVSVVPGNHDIYVELGADPGIGRWDAYMLSNVAGATAGGIKPAIGHYGGAGTWRSGAFPYVRRIGHVAVVGVCSARPTLVGWASGTVGRPQLDRLAAILDQLKQAGLARLVMIHHPPLPGQAPPRRALEDAQALSELLERYGADLVIHGHNHTQTSVIHAAIPILGVASASACRDYGDEPPARYNLITVTGEAIEIETRGLNTADQCVMHIAAARYSRR